MLTPWGKSNSVKQYDNGFYSVSTGGHGGIMISISFAKYHLTESACKRGMAWGKFLCYEEDCAWSIPVFELKQYWDLIFSDTPERIKNDPYNYLLESLSSWNADYLLERQIPVHEQGYYFYRCRMLDEKMRNHNYRKLMVCARGDWYTKIPGTIAITTADGKDHIVNKEIYDSIMDKPLKLVNL